MKRIVQCPACGAKLSVFDLGKPITQKCPKCEHTFDVMPESAADAPTAEASGKEARSKPPPADPAALAVDPMMPASVETGISFLHVLVIFALLFIIIGVQVFTFKKTDARLTALKEQVNALTAHVQSLAKKTAQ